MRVVLCALTGVGNGVLDSLLKESCEVACIFTRKEPGPFPYYDEENLTDYARKKGIEVIEDFDWKTAGEKIKGISPDLLLVATFHKIIPVEIISSAKVCINLHPSLLPVYQGRIPIDWVLLNEEKETGVTAHLLTNDIDGGDILIQKIVAIKTEEKKSTLLKKIAELSAIVATELVQQIKDNSLRSVPQDKAMATFFPSFRDVIVILGGVLRKKDDGSGWRTSNCEEKGDTHGALGDRLRVVAGSLLYKERPRSLIIASGGRGKFKNIPGIPTLAEVVKDELKELGVPEVAIILEEKSGNTYEQLQEIKKIIDKLSLRRTIIISNDYHLPRVNALISKDCELKKFESQGRLETRSAESILLEKQPGIWKNIIDNFYKSCELKAIQKSEAEGVKRIFE